MIDLIRVVPLSPNRDAASYHQVRTICKGKSLVLRKSPDFRCYRRPNRRDTARPIISNFMPVSLSSAPTARLRSKPWGVLVRANPLSRTRSLAPRRDKLFRFLLRIKIDGPAHTQARCQFRQDNRENSCICPCKCFLTMLQYQPEQKQTGIWKIALCIRQPSNHKEE